MLCLGTLYFVYSQMLSTNLCREPFRQNFLPPKFCIIWYFVHSPKFYPLIFAVSYFAKIFSLQNFVSNGKRLIYSNRTVTVKCCSASFNFYAIACLAFSYGFWNMHVYNIWLVVALSTECIATVAVAIARNIGSNYIWRKYTISCIVKYWAI